MLTPWGYEVESLPDLIDVDAFNAMTGNRYADDPRTPAAIAAASAAIRNACGWHVAPVMACTFTTDGDRGDLWLPCVGLRSVESVKFDGVSQTVEGFNRLGRVRTASPMPRGGLGNVTAEYTAGFDLCTAPGLADVVKDRVVAAIANGYGVTSETVGAVSVSYASDAATDRGGAFVTPSMARALMPYRLVRSHAA